MKRTLLRAGGICSVLLLLAAAAFAGAWLSRRGLDLPNGPWSGIAGGAPGSQGCDSQRVPAGELPGPPAMRRGVLVRRQDNAIFLGVAPTFTSVQNPDGTISTTVSYEGPLAEVVITRNTKLYRDITAETYGHTCGQVQQVLAEGSLKDIVDNTTFLVWGERAGERIIASNLVYDLPVLAGPGSGK